MEKLKMKSLINKDGDLYEKSYPDIRQIFEHINKIVDELNFMKELLDKHNIKY
jgi:hypothetical protein